jgi:hypothetical protein
MSINRLNILLFSVVSILLFGGFKNPQKIDTPIILNDEKPAFIPKEFYIASVTDERSIRNAVAFLVHKDEAHGYATRPSDLKGGAAFAIKQFIHRNLEQNPGLRPVVITINTFNLAETNQPGGRVSGRLSIGFSFGLQRNYGIQQLVNYNSGTNYNRSDNTAGVAEPVLRQGIEGALAWFNKWINTNADVDFRLAKAVKVKFSDYTEQPEGDTIYYATGRPLTWADFKDKPMAGNFEAEVFTSIGYTEQATIEKGVIHLYIAVKAEMPKSDCWVRDGGRDDYDLNHEQRHFDITRIVAEHFKQKIAAVNLPPENYDGDINVQYLETLRELTRMEQQYDHETHHGVDRAAQEGWNNRIDKQLRELGVKK